MLLLIDNYDSFTYNLAQAFTVLGEEVRVVRNDQVTVAQAERMRPDRVVISPGPGEPTGAGISVDLIRRLAGRVPVLGVCLGHQCLAYAGGATIQRAGRVMHGKVSPVRHDGSGVHTGVASPFGATRYHSLVVRPESLPARFRVTAWSEDDGEIMAITDESAGQYGVQYHPESILTPAGTDILRNFLAIA